MSVPAYYIPRETGLEGIGPFTVTDPNPDATWQASIHAYGARPATWFDSETINGTAGYVGVGTASAHWAAIMTGPGKWRISVRDKETPSFERIGVADLFIT